jgi:hypothetical protein
VRFWTLSDGTLDHQSAFVLLDKSSRILGRSEHTASVDANFVSLLQTAANAR